MKQIFKIPDFLKYHCYSYLNRCQRMLSRNMVRIRLPGQALGTNAPWKVVLKRSQSAFLQPTPQQHSKVFYIWKRSWVWCILSCLKPCLYGSARHYQTGPKQAQQKRWECNNGKCSFAFLMLDSGITSERQCPSGLSKQHKAQAYILPNAFRRPASFLSMILTFC